MQTKYLLPAFVFLSGLALSTHSCKHEPFLSDVTPVDTTGNPIDTIPGDTTNMGEPCDPDVVYFELQVLPILQSNCAMSGCHDEATAQDGVILTSYQRVMQTADVRPYNLSGSDLYEVITDNDPDDRMPPPPNSRLSQEQISLIGQWIMQGAENKTCDPNAGECDTQNVSFSAEIWPVIQNSCTGCHSGGNPSGGISLTNHATVSAAANNGKLQGVISWQDGFPRMPQGGQKLNQCFIDKVAAWINAGKPNN